MPVYELNETGLNHFPAAVALVRGTLDPDSKPNAVGKHQLGATLIDEEDWAKVASIERRLLERQGVPAEHANTTEGRGRVQVTMPDNVPCASGDTTETRSPKDLLARTVTMQLLARPSRTWSYGAHSHWMCGVVWELDCIYM